VIENDRTNPNSCGGRLLTHARDRSDYRLFVGVPMATPIHWTNVRDISENGVVTATGEFLPLSQITAFIVAYSNGQMMDAELSGLQPPPGITGLQPSSDPDSDVLTLDDLEPGRRFIEVTYGRSIRTPHSPHDYSTTLRNISGKRVRVLRFGAYRWIGAKGMLSTATGKFYSADEFRNWYGLGNQEWILPGTEAMDANNRGTPPTLWAYYCEADDGEQFIAGRVIERPIQERSDE